jgi:hypothetical protein
MLQVLVPILRRDGELDLSDGEAALPAAMSASTIDRRVAKHAGRRLVTALEATPDRSTSARVSTGDYR